VEKLFAGKGSKTQAGILPVVSARWKGDFLTLTTTMMEKCFSVSRHFPAARRNIIAVLFAKSVRKHTFVSLIKIKIVCQPCGSSVFTYLAQALH